MEILVQNIERGISIICSERKGVLTVRDIIELETEPQQYKIYFEGINQPEIYWHDTKLEIMPEQK